MSEKMKKYKILVVEDEEDLCEILKFNLENEGFSVDVVNSAEEAAQLRLERYDVFLLDVMMGKMSGFRLAEKIRREQNLDAPVIFLTARDTENDLLTGFSLGADDYIAKPFSVREVIARVKAVLKRTGGKGETEENVVIDDLIIDVKTKRALVNGATANLTRTEFEIVLLLAAHPDRIFSREEIISKIWPDDVVVSDRTVDVHIARVRKKLGDYGRMLVNRSGYGYRFEPDQMEKE